MFLLLSTIFLINFLCINSCPSGSSKGPNGNCYKVINSEDQGNPDWFGAESLCHKDGGHLASISDSFTNSFIANLARTVLGDSSYWIGAVRTMTWWNNTLPLNQTWTWLDFKDFQYTNWNKSMQVQPNPDFLYLCLTQDSVTGTWNPVDCYLNLLPFACEYTNSTQDLCPEDDLNHTIKWTHLTAFGEKCYGLVYPDPYTIYGNFSWNDALNYCSHFSSNSNQASLVSIHSDLENAIITIYMSYDTNVYYYDEFWIGLQIPSNNSTNMTWSDGTLVDFTYWFDSQQILAPGFCTEYIMSFHSGDRWDLNACNRNLAAFVCEYWNLK